MPALRSTRKLLPRPRLRLGALQCQGGCLRAAHLLRRPPQRGRDRDRLRWHFWLPAVLRWERVLGRVRLLVQVLLRRCVCGANLLGRHCPGRRGTRRGLRRGTVRAVWARCVVLVVRAVHGAVRGRHLPGTALRQPAARRVGTGRRLRSPVFRVPALHARRPMPQRVGVLGRDVHRRSVRGAHRPDHSQPHKCGRRCDGHWPWQHAVWKHRDPPALPAGQRHVRWAVRPLPCGRCLQRVQRLRGRTALLRKPVHGFLRGQMWGKRVPTLPDRPGRFVSVDVRVRHAELADGTVRGTQPLQQWQARCSRWRNSSGRWRAVRDAQAGGRELSVVVAVRVWVLPPEECRLQHPALR